jgi:hypothetical protein
MVASVAAQGFGSNFVIGVQAVTIAIMLLLLWFISRKGSRWRSGSMWSSVFWTRIRRGRHISDAGIRQHLVILSTVQYVLLLISLFLLFRPDSKAWFADGRGGDADVRH